MTTVTDAEAIVQAIIGTPNTILSQASYDALVAGIKAAEARARLEGAEIMREAAATVIREEVSAQAHDDEWDIGFNYAKKLSGSMVLHLNPAAILEAHMRAKEGYVIGHVPAGAVLHRVVIGVDGKLDLERSTIGDSDGDDGA